MSLGYNQITSAAKTGGSTTTKQASKLAAVQSRTRIWPSSGIRWLDWQGRDHVMSQAGRS